MKLKLRFLLAGLFVTASCVCDWAQLLVRPLSDLLFLAALFLAFPSRTWTEPLRWSPRSQVIGIFLGLGIVLALIIFSLLGGKIPAEWFDGLERKWYFMGPIWLLLLSLLAGLYAQEKRKQKAAPDGSSSAG